ncbi:MAG: sensor domain-containing diguanylate cyclase [Actinomycetota bacterium]
MRGTGSVGVRGTLVILGALPMLLAVVAVAAVSLLIDRDARASLDHADAVRDFEIASGVLNDFDLELALVDGWNRSDRFQSEAIADTWVQGQFAAVDATWREALEGEQELDDDIVDELSSIHAGLLELRAAYGERDLSTLEAGILRVRSRLDGLTAEVNAAVLARPGSSWALLVELAELRSGLAAETILITLASVDGVSNEIQRTTLLLRRAESDQSLDRVERLLSGAQLDRFLALVDSEDEDLWQALRTRAFESSPLSASERTSEELIDDVFRGTRFVLDIDDFMAGVLDDTATEAQRSGEEALRDRNLLIAAGSAIVLLLSIVTLLVARHLARRIVSVARLAEEISGGELAVEPLELAGHDEVARLSGAMDDLVVTLRRVNDQVEAIAAGRTDDPILSEELPGSIGRTLRVAIEGLGRTTEELRRQATHDALTGLLDRSGLEQVIEAWDAERTQDVGVLLLDLDGFKAVNDEHGHEAGDHVLRGIATRLTSVARSTDVVARLGGDEFAVLLAPGVDPSAVERVGHRLVELTSQPTRFGGRVVTVGASVGWVVAEPGTPTTVAMRRADAAMYAAKRAGKGQAMEAAPV